MLAALPADFAAGIVVVQHLDPRHRSLLSDILGRRTALKVREAADGNQVARGQVFIAPANHNLMGGTVIVQDRKSCEFSGMPEAALKTGFADFVLPLEEIAPALRKLVRG